MKIGRFSSIPTNFKIFLPSQSILAIPGPIFEPKIEIAKKGWFYPFFDLIFPNRPQTPKMAPENPKNGLGYIFYK